jgi:succinoglycan biosynthesis transport protein ExoP
MPLRRYLTVLVTWWWLLALGALLAGGAAYVWSGSLPPVYRASTKLLITPATGSSSADLYSGLLSAERLGRTYADLIKSRPILEQAARASGLTVSYEALTAQVQARLIRETQILEISVEHRDPVVARDLAGSIASTFAEQN